MAHVELSVPDGVQAGGDDERVARLGQVLQGYRNLKKFKFRKRREIQNSKKIFKPGGAGCGTPRSPAACPPRCTAGAGSRSVRFHFRSLKSKLHIPINFVVMRDGKSRKSSIFNSISQKNRTERWLTTISEPTPAQRLFRWVETHEAKHAADGHRSYISCNGFRIRGYS